jgi:hypothetical protein
MNPSEPIRSWLSAVLVVSSLVPTSESSFSFSPRSTLLVNGFRCLCYLTHLSHLLSSWKRTTGPVPNDRYLTLDNIFKFSEPCEHRHVISLITVS